MPLPRWKKEQKTRKKKKKFKLAQKIALVVFLTLFLGASYQIWGSFKKCLWDGKSRFNLVFNSQPILLVSFEPQEKELIFLAIPENTLVEAIHGYGFYKASSVWRLGKLEGYGDEFFSDSFQEHFGILIDGYISMTNLELVPGDFNQPEKLKSFLPQTMLALIKSGAETNLTKWDAFRLAWQTKGIRLNKIKFFDLKEAGLVEELSLPDGTLVLKTNHFFADQLLASFWSEPMIKKEDLSIAVYNGTPQPGLAKKASRLINSFGGRVVEVGDWDKEKASCEVRSEESNFKSKTVQKLLKVFDCQFMEKEMQGSQAEVVVIVGQNYSQKLKEK